MKLSDKLDMLQKMAQQCAGDQHKLYLVTLLAEHAEEEKITKELLERVSSMLNIYGAASDEWIARKEA